MFRKVLKYDMAAIRRYWLFLALTVLALSTVGSLILRGVIYVFAEPYPDSMLVLSAMAGMAFVFLCILAVFSSVFVTSVLSHYRFYRNFFTDEGYLTFTLPVRRKTLYLSKTLNTMIWVFSHVLLLVLCLAIAFTLAPLPEKGHLFNFLIWEGIGDGLSGLWDMFGGWLIVYILELILLYLGSLAISVGLVQCCITIGAVITKKYKLLAGIGIYYACNIAYSTALQILSSLFSLFMSPGYFILMERISDTAQMGTAALIFLLGILAEISIACVLHFITLGLLERKLNLP